MPPSLSRPLVLLGLVAVLAGLRPAAVADPPKADADEADKAARAQANKDLKAIALGLWKYQDKHKSFPPAAIVDKAGKPLLSWRVLILPHIEQEALYKQFKLDEPWDSEHNKALLAKMPKRFAPPGKPADGTTHYRVFVGNGAAFDLLTGVKAEDFEDGSSNTILVATAAEAVPWTKPDELAYDPDGETAKLLGFGPDGRCPIVFADGFVSSVKKTIDPKRLGRLVQRNDGEAIGPDDD